MQRDSSSATLTVISDKQPPTVVSAAVSMARGCDLWFQRACHRASAENLTNYVSNARGEPRNDDVAHQ
jgi:hypothetical protein